MFDGDTSELRIFISFADVLGQFTLIGICTEIIGTHLSPSWSAKLTVVLRTISNASKGGFTVTVDEALLVSSRGFVRASSVI